MTDRTPWQQAVDAAARKLAEVDESDLEGSPNLKYQDDPIGFNEEAVATIRVFLATAEALGWRMVPLQAGQPGALTELWRAMVAAAPSMEDAP